MVINIPPVTVKVSVTFNTNTCVMCYPCRQNWQESRQNTQMILVSVKKPICKLYVCVTELKIITYYCLFPIQKLAKEFNKVFAITLTYSTELYSECIYLYAFIYCIFIPSDTAHSLITVPKSGMTLYLVSNVGWMLQTPCAVLWGGTQRYILVVIQTIGLK